MRRLNNKKHINKRFYYLITLLLISNLIFAQNNVISFKHLTVEEGLSQNIVTCILQDNSGFMWFGTQGGGLNRYDGYNFISFKHSAETETSILSNNIFSIYEDSLGTIWVGTYDGLSSFNRANETFKNYINDPNDSLSISKGAVKAIVEDKAGYLWIGTYPGGLNKFDTKTGQFIHYTNKSAKPYHISSDLINCIIEDKDENIWVGTQGGGLIKIDKNGKKKTYWHNQNNKNSISDNIIKSLYQDKEGTLWIGTYLRGLVSFNIKENKFTRYFDGFNAPDDPDTYTPSSSWVNSIIEDKSGKLWLICNNSGVSMMDRTTGKFIHSRYNPDNPSGLSTSTLSCIVQDKTGIFWVGTAMGVNYFDYTPNRFTSYKHDTDNPKSLSNNFVSSFYEDSIGDIWIGTYKGGLNKFNIHSKEFITHNYVPEDESEIPEFWIFSILNYQANELLIGTMPHGVKIFNKKTGEFKIFPKNTELAKRLSNQMVSCVSVDKKGDYWIGTMDKGLIRISNDEMHVKLYYRADNDTTKDLISSRRITYTYVDSNGDLWIATKDAGICKYDREHDNFIRYFNIKDDSTSLSNNTVYYFYEDKTGTLWIGTGFGLDRFNKQTSSFSHYTTKNGLPSDGVLGILEDDNKNLWFSTINGLCKFNPETEEIHNFFERDGIQGNLFLNSSCYKTKDGIMFFGGHTGFTMFNPDSIKLNDIIPQIAITDFQLFNKSIKPQVAITDFRLDNKSVKPEKSKKHKKSVLTKSINETKKIILTYKDYIFSFEFAALDYKNPEKNKYKYMLAGFDEDWIETNAKRRYVTYTNIPSGDYKFIVKASNNDGIWNNTGTSIDVTILPPPWKTWWAYTLYIIIIAAAVYFSIILYTKKQRKEFEEKKRQLKNEREITKRLRHVDKLKDEFLANTSHELRTPLNGIIGISESLIDGAAGKLSNKVNSNLSIIINSGKRLANLVNDILDFSKLKNNELILNKKALGLKPIVDLVLALSTPLLAGKEVTVTNNIDVELSPVLADENRLQQILFNLVGNAIKFTETGEIKLKAEQVDDMIQISIYDTGIGIPGNKIEDIFKSFEQIDSSSTREYVGTGIGLSITRKLIDLHNGKIWVESELGKGSKFTFTIPVSDRKAEIVSTAHILSKVQESESEESITPIVSTGQYRILIVDDEPINQQVLANHLSFANYTIKQAYNGADALKAIDEAEPPFDLILLDIMMPKMSGYEVCTRIRNNFMPSELPVLMITAKNQLSDLIEGFSSGANDYIAKPFSKDELLVRIKTHLNLLKINSSYSRFVPRDFMRTLKKESIIDVKLGDHVEGEMTVLFSDIRSFTTISEGMTPEENFNFLNDYLKHCIPAIHQNEGFIDKYIGDAVMAIFPYNPTNAIIASIRILKELEKYNIKRQQNKQIPINIGVGIHTGALMLGTIGNDKRMDGTVISDAVNLASRLEGLTKPFGATIIISEFTLNKINNPDDFNYRFLFKVQVKGKNSAVKVYEIFDGDTEELINLKLQTKAEYEKAIQHYFAKEFSKALPLFESVLQQNQNDKASTIYIERLAQLILNPVGDDWEGIETMDTK